MKLFELESNTPTITPEALLIKEFKSLWDRDDKKKITASKELAFIYFYTDYNSIYNAYSESEKVDQLKLDLELDKKWKLDSVVKAAIARYEVLQQTPSMSFLKSVRRANQQVKEYFDTVDLQERDNQGRIVHKINDLTKAMGESAKIIESLDKWEEKVRKEQTISDEKIYGGGKKGTFED